MRNNTHIILKRNDKIDLLYILAILNSDGQKPEEAIDSLQADINRFQFMVLTQQFTELNFFDDITGITIVKNDIF